MNNEMLSKKDIVTLMDEIAGIYSEDEIPWVIGYSGGKDSTAALQLVWNALVRLGAGPDSKPVHVITVDTMVESPVVATWVEHSLEKMRAKATATGLPIQTHKLTPQITDTFWVSLLGRGYPFPKKSFRWCTDRLKIKPTNDFIQNMIARHGEVIMVLGTRKAESANRQQTLSKFEKLRTREHLNPSTTMANEFIYPVLEDWSNDNVWQYLMMEKNPWDNSNKDLLSMYRGATADNECPLVMSTDTPSCGNSRFGCWVCTVVEKDKSMAAMILNDEEKKWMLPLLELRNEIGNMELEKQRRDFRRMDGALLLRDDDLVHGPYKKEVREAWLERLLTEQEKIRSDKTCPVEEFTLITDAELRQIRTIWLQDKHEFDDSLPRIYERATGRKYEEVGSRKRIFGAPEWDLLREVTTEKFPEETMLFELQANLIDLEQHASNMRYRHGILSSLEKAIQRCYYKDKQDALLYERERKEIADRLLDKKEEVYTQTTLGDLAE